MSPWACWGTGIQNNTTFLHFGSCSYDMHINGDSWSQTFQGNSINSNEPSLQTCPIMSYPHTAASLSNIRYSNLILGKIDIKSSWLENCKITCTIVWIGQLCEAACSRSHKAQKLSMVMHSILSQKVLHGQVWIRQSLTGWRDKGQHNITAHAINKSSHLVLLLYVMQQMWMRTQNTKGR